MLTFHCKTLTYYYYVIALCLITHECVIQTGFPGSFSAVTPVTTYFFFFTQCYFWSNLAKLLFDCSWSRANQTQNKEQSRKIFFGEKVCSPADSSSSEWMKKRKHNASPIHTWNIKCNACNIAFTVYHIKSAALQSIMRCFGCICTV